MADKEEKIIPKKQAILLIVLFNVIGALILSAIGLGWYFISSNNSQTNENSKMTVSSDNESNQTISTNGKDENESIANKSRFSLNLRDKSGSLYNIYIFSNDEKQEVQSIGGGYNEGDIKYSGTYYAALSPAGSDKLEVQNIPLFEGQSNIGEFNIKANPCYILKAHDYDKGLPDILVITQYASSNLKAARFFIIKQGELVPVKIGDKLDEYTSDIELIDSPVGIKISIYNNADEDHGWNYYYYMLDVEAESFVAVDEASTNELNFEEVSSILSISMDEFINKYGEPINKEINYDDYLGDNTVTLYYSSGEAFFIPSYYEKDNIYLSYIIIQSRDIKGPYGISVGDDIKTVFTNFPKKEYEEDYIKDILGGSTSEVFGPNVDLIYLSEAGEDVGIIEYNEMGQIISVEYIKNFETGGATRLRFEINKDEIDEIMVYKGYM